MLTLLLLAGFPFWPSLSVAGGFYALFWLALDTQDEGEGRL